MKTKSLIVLTVMALALLLSACGPRLAGQQCVH